MKWKQHMLENNHKKTLMHPYNCYELWVVCCHLLFSKTRSFIFVSCNSVLYTYSFISVLVSVNMNWQDVMRDDVMWWMPLSLKMHHFHCISRCRERILDACDFLKISFFSTQPSARLLFINARLHLFWSASSKIIFQTQQACLVCKIRTTGQKYEVRV